MFSGGSNADPYVFGELARRPIGCNRTLTGKSISTPRLNAGESTGVFIIYGQSNACNVGTALYTPTHGSKIDNLSIYDGGTYVASEPLLGCENFIGGSPTVGSPPLSVGGNLFYRMADKLITAGKYQRVILIPAAIGGIALSEAITSPCSDHLVVAFRRAAAVGLTVTAGLFMQGEADNGLGTSTAAYGSGLASLVSIPANAGFTTKWLIGQCTYSAGTVSTAVQAAQVAAANGTTIFAGANTDTLTGTSVNRQVSDNIHLTAAGQDSAATLWSNAIIAAL